VRLVVKLRKTRPASTSPSVASQQAPSTVANVLLRAMNRARHMRAATRSSAVITTSHEEDADEDAA
jgi:hypothetical protein